MGSESLTTSHAQQYTISHLITQPLVCLYVASPIPTYQTLRYDRMLTIIRQTFPDCELLPARELFPDTTTWKQRWSTLLDSIDAIAFFDDGKRYIGRGVYHEVLTARRQGKPIWYFSDDGFFWRYPSELFLDLLRHSYQRWARVKINTRTGLPGSEGLL